MRAEDWIWLHLCASGFKVRAKGCSECTLIRHLPNPDPSHLCTFRRKVGLSEFKGQLYVNVREFYADAAGELKHGAKV